MFSQLRHEAQNPTQFNRSSTFTSFAEKVRQALAIYEPRLDIDSAPLKPSSGTPAAARKAKPTPAARSCRPAAPTRRQEITW